MSIKTSTKKNEVVHDSLPPDGGCYGYVVFIAVTIIAITISLPLGVFGIVFGNFLSTVGDETIGTSLANGMFNTVCCLTGLVSNVLLNKWTCREVGLLGAMFCVIGCFSLIFVNDLIWFIVFFGVFQGFGYGLLLPASLTALNNAFDKKLSFMMSLSQAVMVACCMLMPPCASAVMNTWGFRGAIFCIGGVTLLNIPAAIVLTRFKWRCENCNHTSMTYNNNNFAYIQASDISIKCKSTDELTKIQSVEPLLKRHNSLKNFTSEEVIILHIADRTASIVGINKYTSSIDDKEKKSLWKSITSSVDCSLLTHAKYLNISVGLSLSSTSDICFITIFPVLLSDMEFSNSEIALTMSVFFGSDLVSRILLSIVSSMTTIKSRYLVLGGSFLSVIFRVAFVWCRSYTGKLVTLAALGFLRCFIQTPLPLVLSEEYPDQFSTAFSLYMVVCGIVTLAFGPLMSLVKSFTGTNEMVCHLLTSCYIICVISWLLEMSFDLRKKEKSRETKCQEVDEYKV